MLPLPLPLPHPFPHRLPLLLPLLPLLLSLMCQRHCQRLQLLSMQRGERQEALQLLLAVAAPLLLQPFSGTWWSVQPSARPRAWESHSVKRYAGDSQWEHEELGKVRECRKSLGILSI